MNKLFSYVSYVFSQVTEFLEEEVQPVLKKYEGKLNTPADFKL